MFRQLLLVILFGFSFAQAKQPTHHTYVVPSPNEKSSEEKTEEPKKDYIDQGLDTSYTPKTLPRTYTYHLPPQPSVTIQLSRIYDVVESEHGGWIGIHGSPVVKPTSRWQYGIDIREDFGWVQVAWHKIPRRTLSRFYYGVSMSVIILAEDELRPLLKLKNYYLGGVSGWEFQLRPKQNIRLELSYHQGTEAGLLKGAIGYTLLL